VTEVKSKWEISVERWVAGGGGEGGGERRGPPLCDQKNFLAARSLGKAKA